jgi:glycosyltransferase involved in cell wall biosynthesis
MKILLLNQTFYPDPVATAQYLTDFSEDAARAGHEVTAVTGQRGYTDPGNIYAKREKYLITDKRRTGVGKLPGSCLCASIRIERVWPFSFGRKRRGGRILDALFMNLLFAWQLFWLPRFDRIVVLTSPPLVGWVAAVFAKLRGSQVIYWMMDINPDEAILAGWLRQDSIAARVLEAALRFVLKASHVIIVLDEFMRDRIVAKGADPESIRVIPPWSHDEALETTPHDRNPFRKEQGWDGKFVVMYSGNHSVCHPLDTLLEAALKLKDHNNIVFAFIGGGERVRDVLRFKERNGLQNIIHLPYQNRSDLKRSLSAADVHIAVMGDPFVGVVHPCKIYGILQIGRPFIYIGPEKSHIGMMVESEGVGFQVRHGQVAKLADLIDAIRRLDSAALEKIRNKEQQVAVKYSRKYLSQQLMDACI